MAADFTNVTERQREIVRFVYCQHNHRTSFGGVKYNAEANAVNKTAVRDGVMIDSMIPKDGPGGNVAFTQAEVDDCVTKGYLSTGVGENGQGVTYTLTNDGRLMLGQLGDRHPY